MWLPAAAVLIAAGLAAYWYLQRAERAFPAFVKTSDQNILIVTIDTLRADALGCDGGRARTPNLDRLASQGVRFTFAHAHAVMTLPSHTSIMTGRYPFEHGVRDNAGFRLEESADTLAEDAHAKGFTTGAFVGAFPLDRGFGLAQGFDTYDDVTGREVAPADFAFSERRAGEVVAAARAWIEQQKRPWLAWVHVFDPHSPYAPPPPFNTEYANDPYSGEVAYVDAALGPLLELAHRSTRPTTVIVTGDHGEGLGQHGEATHGVFAYETTLHVPLFLAQIGPGIPSRSRGAVSDVPVRHVDILPTIADLTGIPVARDLPGRTLLSPQQGERDSRTSYFEAMMPMLKRGWAPLQGVIVGREKYVNLPLDELYDLARDPGEERNLARVAQERVRALDSQLRAFSAALPGAETAESVEVRARLRSLGYLSGSAPRKARYTEEDDPKGLVDVDRLMMEGIELNRAGRSAEAIDAYRRVIERRPDMGLAYRRLAYIQWESGATRDAIATLREALARNGSDLNVEVRLGTYLAETGAVTEALPMLERASEADSANAETLNALGIAYARAGRDRDALQAFDRILRINPKDAFALENVGTIALGRGDLAEARKAFAQAAANDPRSSRAAAGLGVVAMKSGRRDEALEYWRRAVELDPRNFDALYNLGTELLAAGQVVEARRYLEQFVRTAPAGFYGPDIERLKNVLAH